MITCFSKNTNAQVGWQWAIGSTIYNPHPYTTLLSLGAPNIATDKLGNVFLSGVNNTGDSARFGSFMVRNTDHSEQLIILKADSFGKYVGAYSSSSAYHYPAGIAADSLGNLYYIDYPNNSFRHVAKMKSSGFGYVSNYFGSWTCYFTGISIDQNNNLYMSGFGGDDTFKLGRAKLVSRGGSDIFIAKVDSLGNYIWIKTFGGKGGENVGGTGGGAQQMVATGTGKVYVFGYYSSDTMFFDGGRFLVNPSGNKKTNFLAMLDSSGNLTWAQNVSSSWYVRGMATDQSENVYLTGEVYSPLVFGKDTIGKSNSTHFALVKYAPSGYAVWAKAEDAKNSKTTSTGISVDKCGNIWISGAVFTGFEIKFGEDYVKIPNYSTDPLFISHYDTSGQHINSMIFPTGGTNYGTNGIVVDYNGNFYVGGQYARNIVFGNDTLTCGDSVVLFIAKYKYSNSNCDKLWAVDVKPANVYFEKTIIYPNPANNELYVENTRPKTEYSLCNLAGVVMVHGVLSLNENKILLGSLSPGIYLLQLTDEYGKREVHKIIKQ